jgi:transposase
MPGVSVLTRLSRIRFTHFTAKQLKSLDRLSKAKAMRDIGAWFLFLPPYSPDINPIEMAFSKLKAMIQKAAARTYNELWQVVGNVCDLFHRRGMLQLLQSGWLQNRLNATHSSTTVAYIG